MTTATATLSKNYTLKFPIQMVTSNAMSELSPIELAWASAQWSRFEGGIEDEDFNVICELKTPITNTRIWIMHRGNPAFLSEMPVTLLLPSDY